MGTMRWLLAGGLAVCLALPALAASTPITDQNGKITNVIGASGEGSDNNGNGNASFNKSSGVWEINGGGQGIWNTADGMTFVSTALEGDGNITARLLDEKGGSGDGWMRSGVMIRESDEGNAKYSGVFTANEDSATPRGRHIHAHFRYETEGGMGWGGDTGAWGPEGDRTPTDGGIGLRYFPLYLRAQRRGNMTITFRSDDGKLWEQTTKEQVLEFPATARAGIFVSSDNGDANTLGTTHFDNVSVGTEVLRSGPPSAQAVAGDGSVLVTWTGAAGADSYNVYRRVDPEKGAAATEYVKITAEPTKNTFFTDTGLTNGRSVRYVVTGLVGAEETAGSIHQVAIPAAPLTVGTASFFTQNIDTKSIGTTQVKADGQLEITASGAGINHAGDWTAGYDAFRYLAAPVEGNATLTVTITAKPTSNQDRAADDGRHLGSGIGLMVREGLAPNARYGLINATLGAGVQFQGRTETAKSADVSAEGTDDAGTSYPLFLRIQRAGDTIRGFQSADGTSFTQVGEDLSITGLKAPVYVGIAVSNGFEGFTMTTAVDPTSIKLQ